MVLTALHIVSLTAAAQAATRSSGSRMSSSTTLTSGSRMQVTTTSTTNQLFRIGTPVQCLGFFVIFWLLIELGGLVPDELLTNLFRVGSLKGRVALIKNFAGELWDLRRNNQKYENFR
jgi:hypothetical protein